MNWPFPRGLCDCRGLDGRHSCKQDAEGTHNTNFSEECNSLIVSSTQWLTHLYPLPRIRSTYAPGRQMMGFGTFKNLLSHSEWSSDLNLFVTICCVRLASIQGWWEDGPGIWATESTPYYYRVLVLTRSGPHHLQQVGNLWSEKKKKTKSSRELNNLTHTGTQTRGSSLMKPGNVERMGRMNSKFQSSSRRGLIKSVSAVLIILHKEYCFKLHMSIGWYTTSSVGSRLHFSNIRSQRSRSHHSRQVPQPVDVGYGVRQTNHTHHHRYT